MILDDRLKEIRIVGFNGIKMPLSNEEIAQIKQAFAEEIVAKMDAKQAELMSGAEWYDRFIRELSPPNGSTKDVNATYTIIEVKETAKRASGIKR